MSGVGGGFAYKTSDVVGEMCTKERITIIYTAQRIAGYVIVTFYFRSETCNIRDHLSSTDALKEIEVEPWVCHFRHKLQ